MTILSSFTQPHVILNLYELFILLHKKYIYIFKEILVTKQFLVPTNFIKIY